VAQRGFAASFHAFGFSVFIGGLVLGGRKEIVADRKDSHVQ
jgi:hypothetical protein